MKRSKPSQPPARAMAWWIRKVKSEGAEGFNVDTPELSPKVCKDLSQRHIGMGRLPDNRCFA